jgi:hypothetical protein
MHTDNPRRQPSSPGQLPVDEQLEDFSKMETIFESGSPADAINDATSSIAMGFEPSGVPGLL